MNQEQAVIYCHGGEYISIRRKLTNAQGKAVQGGSKAEGKVQKMELCASSEEQPRRQK